MKLIKASYFFEKIQDVKVKDLLSVFPMTAALLLKPFYRKKYHNVWLVCEDPMEARDNGYHFFRYMRMNQPQQECVYAIKRKSVDFQKVNDLGDTIEYGGVKHWLAYFLCRYNISSQKGGKPNAAVCSFMELSGVFKPHNVFLQHGVTINQAEWLFVDRSRFETFITATVPETEFIEKHFGYPDGTIQLTGFPRFDALHDYSVNNRQILIMPTWRAWFNLKSKMHEDTDSDFLTSEYLKKWLELLNCDELRQLAQDYQLRFIFYPHRNMQRYIAAFENVPEYVALASWEEYDIQDLLKTSAMMITDYSSVFFDMVYMKKPIVFYQFDEEKFRKYQYAEGYFDYHNNPFGRSFRNKESVLAELERFIKQEFKVSDEYLQAHKEYFKLYDRDNCRRVYEIVKKYDGKNTEHYYPCI